MTKLLRDENGKPVVFEEGEGGILDITFSDENGDFLNATSTTAITLSLVDDNGNVINSRSGTNIRNTGIGTIENSGKLTVRLQPADNAIIGTVANYGEELHHAIITWSWNDGVESRTSKESYQFRVVQLPV